MSESEELKRLGAVPQPNSGRGKHKKGDGILDDIWLVDVKEYSKSFSVSQNNWGKICTDAAVTRLEPMLQVVLGNEGEHRTRLVVISQEEFLRLRNLAAGKE